MTDSELQEFNDIIDEANDTSNIDQTEEFLVSARKNIARIGDALKEVQAR
jgi:hypothetical protein